MADTYQKNSIINILSDAYTVNKGSVSVVGDSLVLANNSRCTFNYNYGEHQLKETSKLKIRYNLGVDNNEFSTRYDSSIEIVLRVTLYKQEYSNGEYIYKEDGNQTISIIPYTSDEYKGNYKDEIIELKGNYIKSIDVIINFYNESNEISNIAINRLSIYQTVTIDENEIKNTVNEYLNSGAVPLCIPFVNKRPDRHDSYIGAVYLTREPI